MLTDSQSTAFNQMLRGDAPEEVPVKERAKEERLARSMQRSDVAVRLLTMEYQDAYVDLVRSGPVLLSGRGKGPYAADACPVAVVCATSSDAQKPLGRRVPLREEMPRAVAVYDRAIACMREVMGSASQGRFQAYNADDVVTAIVDSLERNVDALLCLPRIRKNAHPYVYTHSVNVAVLLAAFAMCSGKDRKTVLVHALAGLFHDIGKALLPVSLLNAKRTLSTTEQTLVTRHPMLGCELLASLPTLESEVLLAALEHHERFDGSGYPKGISGSAISEIGHLSAIADAYDALSSRRPYKGAIVPHKTLGVLFQMRSRHFHAEMVERFVRLVGIYPVGSVVELKDGYRAVVSASNYANPMLPTVTLARDPQGGLMCRHECDMAKDAVSGISRCLVPDASGIDPCDALGIAL